MQTCCYSACTFVQLLSLSALVGPDINKRCNTAHKAGGVK